MLEIPKISIIIPAFNAENHINQAITSALSQSYNNIEVIVVDDGSSDNTVKIVKSFTDERLKLLENEENRGVSYSRNRAIEEASGMWIALLDADDWYAPDRLEKLVPIALSENADLLADDIYFIREKESSPWSTFLLEIGKPFETLKQISTSDFIQSINPFLGIPSFGYTKPLIKREFLLNNGIKYDENLQLSEDFLLYLECLCHGARFLFTPQPYYYYNNREFSLTNVTNLEYFKGSEEIFTKFLQKKIVAPELEYHKSLSEVLRAFRKHVIYYSIVDQIRKGDFISAFIQSLKKPYFFLHLSRKMPGILSRLFKFYILKNKLAYDRIYTSSKLNNDAEIEYSNSAIN